jgi:hypothetical protein
MMTDRLPGIREAYAGHRGDAAAVVDVDVDVDVGVGVDVGVDGDGDGDVEHRRRRAGSSNAPCRSVRLLELSWSSHVDREPLRCEVHLRRHALRSTSRSRVAVAVAVNVNVNVNADGRDCAPIVRSGVVDAARPGQRQGSFVAVADHVNVHSYPAAIHNRRGRA